MQSLLCFLVLTLSADAARNLLCGTDWNIASGNWTHDSEACTLHNTGSIDTGIVWLGSADGLTPDPNYEHSSFRVRTVFQMTSGKNAGIIIRVSKVSEIQTEAQDYYVFLRLAGYGSGLCAFGMENNGWTLLEDFGSASSANTIYELEVIADGNYYSVSINDSILLQDLYHANLTTGSIGLRAYNTPTLYHVLQYYPPVPVDAEVISVDVAVDTDVDLQSVADDAETSMYDYFDTLRIPPTSYQVEGDVMEKQDDESESLVAFTVVVLDADQMSVVDTAEFERHVQEDLEQTYGEGVVTVRVSSNRDASTPIDESTLPLVLWLGIGLVVVLVLSGCGYRVFVYIGKQRKMSKLASGLETEHVQNQANTREADDMQSVPRVESLGEDSGARADVVQRTIMGSTRYEHARGDSELMYRDHMVSVHETTGGNTTRGDSEHKAADDVDDQDRGLVTENVSSTIEITATEDATKLTEKPENEK